MLRIKILFLITILNIQGSANTKIEDICERLEKNPNHKLAIDSLKILLKNKKLTDHENVKIYTSILYKYSMLQHFDTCLSIAENQLLLAKQNGSFLGQATFYKQIGNTYYYLKNQKKAIEYFNRSLDISKSHQLFELAEDCSHNIAGTRMEQGLSDTKTEDYLKKAIYYNKLCTPQRIDRQIGHYRLLATLYDYQNKLDMAQNIYEQLLKITRKHKRPYDEMTTLCFYSQVLSRKGKHKEACNFSHESIQMAKPFNDPDALSTTYSMHARNLKQAGKVDSAFQTLLILQSLQIDRYNTNLNKSIAEAEAKFKNAEVEFEKNVAISESKRKVQLYASIFIFTLFLFITGGIFYFHRKKAITEKQKMHAILKAEEEERDRVSRELHDGIGQLLGAAKLNLHAYEENQRKDILEKAIRLIDESAIELRSVSHSLAPVTLKKNGLVLSIKKFLDSLHSHSLKISFHSTQNTIPIDNNKEIVVYRIIQECVSNVIKHAKAKNLFVSLDLNENFLNIMVEDDGKGFEIKSSENADGIGLHNMKVRTEYLRGTMEIDSKLNSGTVFSFRFPLK